MYKKGTIPIRYKIENRSSIGINTIVRLEQNTYSKYGSCLVTKLKEVEIPGCTNTGLSTYRVNLGDFKPITLLQRKHK